MRQQRIILDVSPNTIVVLCNTCPSWREVCTTYPAARRAASLHEASCHPGDNRAREAERDRLRKAATRRA